MIGVHLTNEALDVDGQSEILDDGPQFVRRYLPRLVGRAPQRDERVNRVAFVALSRARGFLVRDYLAKLAKV